MLVQQEILSDLAWHIKNLMIEPLEIGVRMYCNGILHQFQLEPHTLGGCTQCLGGLTIMEIQ